MKTKSLYLIIIILGLAISAYGSWEIIQGKISSQSAVSQAKEIVSEKSNSTEAEGLEAETPFNPKKGDVVGLLEIPKINAELAIIEGTDPDELEKGVGHYAGSYFPNENGQIVLSGHRDTVFRKAGELELGDQLTVQLPTGAFTYKIINTKIVEADDTSIITLQNQQEELIVTTCYPFGYIGDAPQRYIIYAERM